LGCLGCSVVCPTQPVRVSKYVCCRVSGTTHPTHPSTPTKPISHHTTHQIKPNQTKPNQTKPTAYLSGAAAFKEAGDPLAAAAAADAAVVSAGLVDGLQWLQVGAGAGAGARAGWGGGGVSQS